MTSRQESTANRVLAGHEEHWISVSDLMALLMMVFLLIAITYQALMEIEQKKIEEVAVEYRRLQVDLRADLLAEFQSDLKNWGAVIESDLTIRFQEPDILFDSGSADLERSLKAILSDFFPRYVSILTSAKYVDDIEEVRIEGHTSSICRSCKTDEESPSHNMWLSQERTRSTLSYVFGLVAVGEHLPWLRKHATANGLSFSQLVLAADGTEDFAASRRVEFRVKTDAEQKIARIITLTTQE